MLLGLYLLVSILSPWLQVASKRALQGYLGLWAFTSLLGYIHLLFPEILGERFWNPTPMLYYFTGFRAISYSDSICTDSALPLHWHLG